MSMEGEFSFQNRVRDYTAAARAVCLLLPRPVFLLPSRFLSALLSSGCCVPTGFSGSGFFNPAIFLAREI